MAPTPDYDVVVVGGGVAGPAAAVFLARAGLDTLVFDEGPSSLRECAHLGNYLGFPAGIDAERFLDLAHHHIRECGASRRAETVVGVEARDGASLVDPDLDGSWTDGPDSNEGQPAGVRVQTDKGTTVTARRLVAATKYDGNYLEPLGDGALVTDAQRQSGVTVDSALVGDAGRTPVAGVYVAGPLGGCPDQAMIAAGDGARVARAVILDWLVARGHWASVAGHYHDWRVHESAYEPGWDDDYAERLREGAPEGAADERVERVVDDLLGFERERAVSPAEAAERAWAGQRALLEHIDDDVIRAYLDDADPPADEAEPTG